MIERRSQVTVFIILGLIILSAVMLFVFLTSQEGEKLGTEIITSQKVAQEIVPIKRFVEECLHQVSYEATIALGEHGGYTTFENSGLYLDGSPTSSDAFELFTGTGHYIPYWHYVISNNRCHDCVFSSKKPPLEASSRNEFDVSMEANLGRYIDQHLASCLEGFVAFEEEFDISPQADPISKVEITDKDIAVTLYYPLAIRQAGKDYLLELFQSDVQLDLRDIYGFAETLLERLTFFQFFEKNTLQIINGASIPLSINKLPPMIGVDNLCTSKHWYLGDARNKLIDHLRGNVPLEQVYGTLNFAPVDVEGDDAQAFYNQFILTMETPDPIPYEVRFSYNGWAPYLDIYPREGEVLSGNPIELTIPFVTFCQNHYEFSYDLSYPISIEITDPKAFNGEGYTFTFGTEVNIRRNEAINGSNETHFPDYDNSYQRPLLCRENQARDYNTTYHIVDAYTGEEISEAIVSFCLTDTNSNCRQERCILGTTSSPLTVKLPNAGGMVTFTHPDYHDAFRFIGFSNDNDHRGDVIIPIWKKERKQIKVDLKMVTTRMIGQMKNWYFDPSTLYELEENTRATVSLTRINEVERPFSVITILSGDQTDEVELIPGEYTVEISLIKDDVLYIPKEEICVEFPWYLFKSDECEWIPATRMDTIPYGGVVLNEDNGLWILSADDLYENNTIVFTAVGIDTDKMDKHDELSHLSDHTSVSSTHRDALEPRFETAENP